LTHRPKAVWVTNEVRSSWSARSHWEPNFTRLDLIGWLDWKRKKKDPFFPGEEKLSRMDKDVACCHLTHYSILISFNFF
jgi:hypothetical protein